MSHGCLKLMILQKVESIATVAHCLSFGPTASTVVQSYISSFQHSGISYSSISPSSFKKIFEAVEGVRLQYNTWMERQQKY